MGLLDGLIDRERVGETRLVIEEYFAPRESLKLVKNPT